MTNWERVQKERSRGRSWSELAADPRVEFDAPPGSDPGRSLKALYFQRRARADRGGGGAGKTRKSQPVDTPRERWLTRRTLVIGVIGMVVAAALVYVVFFTPAGPGTNVVTYCGGEGSAAHYHPLLVIDVNGAHQPLPYDASQSADIGYVHATGYTNPSLYCPDTAAGPGIHALHTHDGSGIIHAELPPGVHGTPTLGDFFQIWGEPLSHTSVWSYSGTVTAQMLDMDTHQTNTYSSDPASIPLYAPGAGSGTNPYPMPQQLIFNGQYGGGSTGGGFSGEIIWLNVTTGSAAAMSDASCNCSIGACGRAEKEAVPSITSAHLATIAHPADAYPSPGPSSPTAWPAHPADGAWTARRTVSAPPSA